MYCLSLIDQLDTSLQSPKFRYGVQTFHHNRRLFIFTGCKCAHFFITDAQLVLVQQRQGK